jgi:putative transposase
MVKGEFVVASILSLMAALRVFFRHRGDTAIGVLALRQQLAVLKRKRPRPALNRLDLKPETVVAWHRAGFRLYWRWRSRPRSGRPKITEEIRVLIRRMAEENSAQRAPKVHGELLKLGFVVSERWLAFLLNHREVIVAIDFFTVPTVTFRLLYCFFVIEHGRRKIPHFNVTRHPTADWVVHQLR